jgi:hypothetical protein
LKKIKNSHSGLSGHIEDGIIRNYEQKEKMKESEKTS